VSPMNDAEAANRSSYSPISTQGLHGERLRREAFRLTHGRERLCIRDEFLDHLLVFIIGMVSQEFIPASNGTRG